MPTPDIDIRVDDGKISLINANGSSYANPDIDSTFWHAKTVDGLFSFIDEKLSENPFQKTLKFNSKYGYPEEIFYYIDEMIADEDLPRISFKELSKKNKEGSYLVIMKIKV